MLVAKTFWVDWAEGILPKLSASNYQWCAHEFISQGQLQPQVESQFSSYLPEQKTLGSYDLCQAFSELCIAFATAGLWLVFKWKR